MSRSHATPIILKSILNVADPRAPTTWSNLGQRTLLDCNCKEGWSDDKFKATPRHFGHLHQPRVPPGKPQYPKLEKQNQQAKEMKLRAQLASSHLTGPDTHLYIPNWLTFTRELSFLERSDHQSTFYYYYYFFFFSFSLSYFQLFSLLFISSSSDLSYLIFRNR